jgi:purine-binding chemotaxis protein CheW
VGDGNARRDVIKQFVTFELDQQLLGVEILLVREINRQLESTRVQLAPSYILGLANLRGQIVTIFDLATQLGLNGCDQVQSESHNIVLKSNAELGPIRARAQRDDLLTSDEPVGLRVHAIGDITQVNSDEIEPLPANLGALKGRFLSGVVPLRRSLLILLNVGEVLKRN